MTLLKNAPSVALALTKNTTLTAHISGTTTKTLMPDVISDFTGPYAFLHRDAPCPWVTFEGDPYPTVEHAFAAASIEDRNGCRTKHYRAWIKDAPSASMARARGDLLTSKRRPEWIHIQTRILRDLLRQQFSPDHTPDYLGPLASTGVAKLVDPFSPLRGPILMEIRANAVMEIGG